MSNRTNRSNSAWWSDPNQDSDETLAILEEIKKQEPPQIPVDIDAEVVKIFWVGEKPFIIDDSPF